jgi:hypothetical protein
MPGLVPGIRVLFAANDVDDRGGSSNGYLRS